MRSVRFRILLEHYLAFESYWNAVEGAERDWVCAAMSQRFATIARCLSTIAIIAIIGFAVMFGLFAAIVAVILWYLSYLSWCLLRWLVMVIEGYSPAVEDFQYAVRGERDCVFEISPDGVIIHEEVAWLPPGDSTIAHNWSEILEICSTDQHAFFCWNRKRAYIERLSKPPRLRRLRQHRHEVATGGV